MEDLIKRISDLYLKYGIRSVTMDDLARELGVSKKTLYQHFTDKEDVVQKVMEFNMSQQDCQVKDFFHPDDESINAIDQLLDLSRFLIEHLSSVNPSFTYDLQKYYPAIWEKVVDQKRRYVFENLVKNMQLGVKQGVYCNDVNLEIIAKAYVQRMEMSAVDNFLFDGEYSFQEVFETLFTYHIRGIANEKGQKHLSERMQQRNNVPKKGNTS